MTIRVYKGQIVAIVTKTSHGMSKVINLELIPDVLHPTEKWKYVGEPYEVKSNDVRRRESPTEPRYKKHALTQDDLNRLNAARGLNLTAKGGRDFSGLKPSVTVYNEALKKRVITGSPITPVG